jgi:hypothetical protein
MAGLVAHQTELILRIVGGDVASVLRAIVSKMSHFSAIVADDRSIPDAIAC